MATKHFNQLQEAVRKDIERAFGGLQSKWHILTSPIRAWYQEDIHSIVMCCIILHNMMVEEGVSESLSNTEPTSTSQSTSYSIIPANFSNRFEDRREITHKIQSEQTHRDLTKALIEFQWARWGSVQE